MHSRLCGVLVGKYVYDPCTNRAFIHTPSIKLVTTRVQTAPFPGFVQQLSACFCTAFFRVFNLLLCWLSAFSTTPTISTTIKRNFVLN